MHLGHVLGKHVDNSTRLKCTALLHSTLNSLNVQRHTCILLAFTYLDCKCKLTLVV